MAPPIFALIKLLFDPDVSNKVILNIAYGQIKAIGFAKVLAALLGAGVVGVSSFIRVPQIHKILSQKTFADRVGVAQGLSLNGLSLETFNQLIHVVFNYQNNNSFINYGESLLLGLQNVAIILLVKFYRLRATGDIDNLEKIDCRSKIELVGTQLASTIGAILGASIFFSKIAPSGLVSALQVVGIPIAVLSKIPQIYKNHALESTSHLSDITIRANLLGSGIRVFTSVQDYKTKSKKSLSTTNDKILVAGYVAGLLTNAVIVGQSIVYRKKTVDAEDKEK